MTTRRPSKTLAAARRIAVRRLIARMVRRFVDRFDPERIILFGSHARGDAGPESDVDLLVVMPYRGSRARAQTAIRLALGDFPVAKDIVVSSPEEFAWRSKVPGTIERPAACDGEVMHARR
jgi:predicted nucleotidyltransferase